MIEDSVENRCFLGIFGLLRGWDRSLGQSVGAHHADKGAAEYEANYDLRHTIGHIAVLLRCARRKIKPPDMSRRRIALPLASLICLCSLLAAQVPPLTIADEPLPEIDAGVELHVFLHAAGGLPPYVWSVVNGDLPDGITLTPEGLFGGRPSKPGNVAFSLKVEDSGHPARALTKDFQFEIEAPLL